MYVFNGYFCMGIHDRYSVSDIRMHLLVRVNAIKVTVQYICISLVELLGVWVGFREIKDDSCIKPGCHQRKIPTYE